MANKYNEKTTFNVHVHKDKFAPEMGLLGKNVSFNGRKYHKWHYLCVGEDGAPRSSSVYDVRKFVIANQGKHEGTCNIRSGTLKENAEVEDVVWKKGTSFKFDRNGKWDHVRMVPGQEFQGKTYKDGGMLFRGEYNIYQEDYGPDDVRIRTPDEEDYDQIEVTKV